MNLSLSLSLHLEPPPRTVAELLDLTCEAAARYRGGRPQWLTLRAELAAYIEQAAEAGATAEQLGALAETAAPVGSLWSPSRRQGGSRYQLRRWDHDQGQGRSKMVFTAAASTVRQQPRRVVEAREVLGASAKWWRVS